MLKQLVNAINSFDGSDSKFQELKDLVCDVSSNKSLISVPLYKQLVLSASIKMRTFGYLMMNGIDISEVYPFTSENQVERNLFVRELYKSDTGDLLDKKQMDIVQHFEELSPKRMILSAPTSFGKTFILYEIIKRNHEKYKNIILIFPTVSLLNENVKKFKEFNELHNLSYEVINTTRTIFDKTGRNAFVFTPERVLNLIDEHPDIIINFFFMDEIYKIDTSFDLSDLEQQKEQRDTVFRIVLLHLSKKVTDFYLAGPYIELSHINLGLQRFLERFEITCEHVKVELVKKIDIEAWKSNFACQGISYQFEKKGKKEKLKELIHFINEHTLGKTIVFGSTKSKVTELVYEVLEGNSEIKKQVSLKISRFVKHLRNRYSYKFNDIEISQHWPFIYGLEKGIGIHHGGFPKYIQNEVLTLFNEDNISFLFSTTTITEGVNTKAENVIFYGKTKGGVDLSSFDIKNINGRAGRYYHNFIGRIFYLEKEIYDKKNTNEDKLNFSTFDDPPISPVDLDNAEKDDLAVTNSREKESRDEIIKQSGIPESILQKNRLIDKLKQIELIQLMRNLPKDKLIHFSTGFNSISEFLKGRLIYSILQVLAEINIDKLNENNCATRFGKIATDYSYPNGFSRLLKYQIETHLGKTENNYHDNTIAKIYTTTFSEIREIIEFKIPKYITVFYNLLQYVCTLPEININTTQNNLESIIRFYEIGVKTEVGAYLIEIGFPATTTKILEQKFTSIMSFPVKKFIDQKEIIYSKIKNTLDEFEQNLFKNLFNQDQM